MSACVKWAKEQVDTFNIILARQLSSTPQDGEIWKKCMDQAKEHAKMLSDVGLDFKSMIGRGSSGENDQNEPVGLGVGLI
jgi:exocyst complex component 8